MLNFCPKCGNKLYGDKFCANCGADLSKYGEGAATTSGSALDDALSNLAGLANEKSQAEKLRVMIIRGKYDEAKTICDELIDNSPMDKVGYIGLVRIASKNFKEYEGKEIEEQIRIAEEIFGAGELLLDSEYAQYINARKQYLDKKAAEEECRRIESEKTETERKRIEEEKAEAERRRIETEMLEAELASAQREKNRKITLLKDNFHVNECADGTFAITGVIDEEQSDFDIPPNIVSEIGDNAFEGCEMEEIYIPYGVKKIGKEAFQNCYNLKEVNIPSSVKSIGYDAFFGCDDLEIVNINISSELASNGISGIFPSGTLYISFGYGVNEIGDNAFEECEIDEIEIPEGVTKIGDEAFQNCENLKRITIPSSVKSIGYDAFFGCDNLEIVYLSYDSSLTRQDLIDLIPDECEIKRK